MATYTITSGTSGAPVDYCALGTRVNSDIFNINGGYLLVDCDTRYGLGGAAAASFSNIVQPAPVTVNNAFPTRAVQTVERDANDEIVSTTTVYEAREGGA